MDILDVEYAVCLDCGQVVFRIPGEVLGDGRKDTDERPIYHWWGDEYDYVGDSVREELPRVHCGCNS